VDELEPGQRGNGILHDSQHLVRRFQYVCLRYADERERVDVEQPRQPQEQLAVLGNRLAVGPAIDRRPVETFAGVRAQRVPPVQEGIDAARSLISFPKSSESSRTRMPKPIANPFSDMRPTVSDFVVVGSAPSACGAGARRCEPMPAFDPVHHSGGDSTTFPAADRADASRCVGRGLTVR
jgi:hypothetical protein